MSPKYAAGAISNKGRSVWPPNNVFEAVTELNGTVNTLPARPTGVNNCGDISAFYQGAAGLFVKTTCD